MTGPHPLRIDVEMNTVLGYAMSSWERGYGDFVMVPDVTTLRLLPWHPGTAFCVADLQWADGTPVVASPRQILARQADRLAAYGWHALAATELEFIVLNDTFEQAWQAGYRALTPANLYNVDYSLLGTGRVEPLLRRIRNEMGDAGMWVESAKGECNLGQHEIAFRYTGLVEKADEHSLFKMGAKEIPDRRATASPSWPSTTPARATRATSTSRFVTSRTHRCSSATARTVSRPCSSTSSPACWRRFAS